MEIVSKLVMLILVGMLGACASTLKVTYQSDPPGAALYQGSQMMGYTPYVLQYKVTRADRKRGFKLLNGTTVKWASGASASIPSLSVDLNEFGMDQQFTFQRPDSYPGRDVDMQFALKLQELAIMRQQANTQQNMAELQMLNTINQQNRIQQRTPTNCTSMVIGNTIQTNCY